MAGLVPPSLRLRRASLASPAKPWHSRIPAIHVLLFRCSDDMDARDKPGHDELKIRRHRRSAIGRSLMPLPAAAVSFLVSSAPAHADLKLCNRMSYVIEAAIGIDHQAATATRGWFRIDPASCRVVAQGTLTADRLLLHARALSLYGASPAPQGGADTLCIAEQNFVIAAARQCRSGQTAAPFTQINPTKTDDGHLVAYLAGCRRRSDGEGHPYDRLSSASGSCRATSLEFSVRKNSLRLIFRRGG